jgi:hypothetical protein
MEAEATRPYIQEAARTAAGLRQAGYGQALGAAQSDLERQMATRGFQANLFGNMSNLQTGRLGLLGGIGAQQQMLQQRALDVPYQEFQRALAYGPQLSRVPKSVGLRASTTWFIVRSSGSTFCY